MADVLWINGRFTTTDERVLGVEDRGFLFADAVYEVFKFVGKKPLFLLDHFRRLDRSLRTIEIETPWDERAFTADIAALLERTTFDDGIVYIQVTRGEGTRSHFWQESLTPTAIAYSRRMQFPGEEKKASGIRVITTEDRRWH